MHVVTDARDGPR